MTIFLEIYKIILNIVYFFLKIRPVNDKQILFLSRQSDKPSIDFKYIISDLKQRYPEYRVVVLTKRMAKNNPIQIFKYIFYSFKQMYYLAFSKICITDGYQITVSCLRHKKNLKIIQIWHSLGAIKKFGYQSLNTKKAKKIAKIMNMHKNYSYILSSSEEMIKYYSEAFNYSKEKFIVNCLPRVDYLKNTKIKNKAKVYKKYPELKNKEIILYAPTFRDYDDYRFDNLIETFKDSKYALIIKKHPRTKTNIPQEYIYDEVTTLELLSVCKYLITDYSAISIEAAILNKPVILFTYDYDRYNMVEGINLDLKEDFKNHIFISISSLYNFINNKKYDMNTLKKFKQKYICDNKNNTKTIVDFIIKESTK